MPAIYLPLPTRRWLRAAQPGWKRGQHRGVLTDAGALAQPLGSTGRHSQSPYGAAQPDFFQNLTLKDREAEPRKGRGPKRVSRNQSRDSLRPSSAPKKKGTAGDGSSAQIRSLYRVLFWFCFYLCFFGCFILLFFLR